MAYQNFNLVRSKVQALIIACKDKKEFKKCLFSEKKIKKGITQTFFVDKNIFNALILFLSILFR
jgi:hypothetical protein